MFYSACVVTNACRIGSWDVIFYPAHKMLTVVYLGVVLRDLMPCSGWI
jgi:hypothetical protein